MIESVVVDVADASAIYRHEFERQVQPVDEIMDVVDDDETDKRINDIVVEKLFVVIILNLSGDALIGNSIDVVDGRRSYQIAGNDRLGQNHKVVEVALFSYHHQQSIEDSQVDSQNLDQVPAEPSIIHLHRLSMFPQKKVDYKLAPHEVRAQRDVHSKKAQQNQLGQRQKNEDK